MGVIVEYAFSAFSGGNELEVIELEHLSMDADRIPYVEASLVIGYPGDAVWALLDPRQAPLIPTVLLSVIANNYETDGGPGPSSTVRFPPIVNPGDPPAKLWIRELEFDHVTRQVTMSLTSGEFLLDDKRNLTGARVNTAQANLQGLVNYAVTQTGQTLASFTGTNPAYAAGDDRRYWEKGDALNDLIETELNAVGSRLWCDEVGAFHVGGRESFYPAVLVAARDGDGGSIIGVTQNRSRTGRWADGAHIRYEWKDGTGTPLSDSQSSTASSTRAVLETRNRPKPAANAAIELADRAKVRGDQYTVESALSLALRPGNTLQVTVSGTTLPACRVRALDWQPPAGLMTVLMESGT